MAKCPTCQHKITAENRQVGKCPECGAPLAPLSKTAQPPMATQAPDLPGAEGTAAPPQAAAVTGETPFSASRTIKPLAELDRTIVEQTLGGEFAGTQAG